MLQDICYKLDFFLEYFEDFFQAKKSYNHESDWVMMVSQPAWSSSLGLLFSLKRREMGKHWPYILHFPSSSFCSQITLTFGFFFFSSNCNTATLKSVVFNSIDSSALPQVSLFFNVPFIQINKQGKSGIFGSSIFTYCVECYINTIISRRMQSGFLFRLNNITLTQ